jgi:hypothetical protein
MQMERGQKKSVALNYPSGSSARNVQGERHVLLLVGYISSSCQVAFSGCGLGTSDGTLWWMNMSGGIQHPVDVVIRGTRIHRS